MGAEEIAGVVCWRVLGRADRRDEFWEWKNVQGFIRRFLGSAVRKRKLGKEKNITGVFRSLGFNGGVLFLSSSEALSSV